MTTPSVPAEVVPNQLFGLPAHPLLVHVPVVLVPLAAIGAMAALAVPRWRSWLLPLVATGATAALFGVQFAMWSGENLEATTGNGPLIERHVELADQARPLVALFFLAAVAAAAVAGLVARRRDGTGTASDPAADSGEGGTRTTTTLTRLVVPLCALSLLTGAFATAWIVQAGHAGSKSVWHDKGSAQGDRGAER